MLKLSHLVSRFCFGVAVRLSVSFQSYDLEQADQERTLSYLETDKLPGLSVGGVPTNHFAERWSKSQVLQQESWSCFSCVSDLHLPPGPMCKRWFQWAMYFLPAK